MTSHDAARLDRVSRSRAHRAISVSVRTPTRAIFSRAADGKPTTAWRSAAVIMTSGAASSSTQANRTSTVMGMPSMMSEAMASATPIATMPCPTSIVRAIRATDCAASRSRRIRWSTTRVSPAQLSEPSGPMMAKNPM